MSTHSFRERARFFKQSVADKLSRGRSLCYLRYLLSRIRKSWSYFLCPCILALLFLSISCAREPVAPESVVVDEEVLARVGSLSIYPEDLAHRLKEKHSGRTDDQSRDLALQDLVRRAQFAQAALDAGLDRDPVVREELGRLLEARYKEHYLAPKIAAIQEIPESRLRELYQAGIERYRSPEKRRTAVLWLNPGNDPNRAAAFTEKLNQAREWVLNDEDLAAHPEKGFSILGADYSEHHATRYTGGDVGWLQREGGMDDWHRAVAEIAFSIEEEGAMSEVVTRPEGLFLVRLMERQAPVLRTFESVSPQLEREERSRLRRQVESNFTEQVATAYAVEWRAPRAPPPE